MTRRRDAPPRIWRMARASAEPLNPQAFVARASSFASAAGPLGTVTLLVHRTDTDLAGYLLAPDGASASAAALHLAQATNARAVEASALPDLSSARAVGWLRHSPGAAAGRESQAGADPAESARRLAVALAPGQWVAVSVRKASAAEKRRHKRWLSARLSTANPVHHSVSSSAVVVAVRAGAEDRRALAALLAQVAAAMPGFDVPSAARVPRHVLEVSSWYAAGLTGWGLAFLAYFMCGVAGWWSSVAGLAGAAGVVVGWLMSTGRAKTANSRLRLDASTGRFRPPLRRRLPPGRPRLRRLENGETVQHEGDYPLAASAFLASPSVVAGIVAPGAGALSGTSSTQARPTPPAVRDPIGPMVGEGADAEPVYLSAADAFAGIFLVGQPGSGKSQLGRSLFGWSCLERVAPSGRPGHPGRANTLVAFESKGEGAAEYLWWAQALGDHADLVDVADPATLAIDLFAVPGSVADRASFFVNAMVYAFEPGAIQDRSFATLTQVFTAALAVTPAIARLVPELPEEASPLKYAYALLGGLGDEAGVSVAGAIMSEAVRLESLGTPDDALSLARAALAPLYQERSEAFRRSLFDAPSSKVAQLLALESWWSPARGKVAWQEILEEHRAVVVNTGTSASGHMLDERLSKQMSALLMFTLRDAIRRCCSGWQATGRSVSVFADELSLLTGSSAEVVTWMRDQGRSYGVRPTFATQYAEQLPERVRTAMTGFSTIIAFAQDSVRVAAELAADFAADGTAWSASDVVNLSPFTAIVRSTVNRQRQPAFTMRVAHLEADRAAFAERQGRPPGEAA
ncbi:type IV secretory system conjugative DNA transfer family protein [Myceligenerans halotolerans]